MGSLVLLVVAAVWVAVLVPPLVRSRLENRPNSSVADFRAQLSSLQRAVPSSRAVSMRPMARPLAPSVARPATANRPPLRSGVTIAGGGSVRSAGQQAAMRSAVEPRSSWDSTGRRRTHGDVSRSHARPAAGAGPRSHDGLRRRRTNVLFVLVVVAACAVFLAVTTKSPGMTYAAVGAGIAVVAYLMVLAQAAMTAPARTQPARSTRRPAADPRAARAQRRTHAPAEPRPARRRPAPEQRYRGQRAYEDVRRPAPAPRHVRPDWVEDDWADADVYVEDHGVYGDPLYHPPVRAARVVEFEEVQAARAARARRTPRPDRPHDHQPAPRIERSARAPRPARAPRHRAPAADWSQDPRPSGQIWGDPLFA